MRRNVTRCAALAGLVLVLAGCGGAKGTKAQVFDWYGSYTLEQDLTLRVESMGMTRMQYELTHEPTNRVLVRDVATDTDGWFLVWDEEGRLWGHWDDVGTFVWVRTGARRFERQHVIPGSPLVREMPRAVAQKLPDWAKQSLGLASAD